MLMTFSSDVSTSSANDALMSLTSSSVNDVSSDCIVSFFLVWIFSRDEATLCEGMYPAVRRMVGWMDGRMDGP